MADLKESMFPADLRVQITSRPIMWRRCQLVFTADVYKKVLPQTIRNNFELIESFIFLFIPSSCNNCNRCYKSDL